MRLTDSSSILSGADGTLPILITPWTSLSSRISPARQPLAEYRI